LIRKANENRAVSKNKLDEQFKGFIEDTTWYWELIQSSHQNLYV
jgi:hypothetical protein